LDSQFGRLNYCKIQVVFKAYMLCPSPPSIFTHSLRSFTPLRFVHSLRSFTPLRFVHSLRSLRRSILTAARPLFFWLCSGYALVMLWLCCGWGLRPRWFIERSYPSQGGGTPTRRRGAEPPPVAGGRNPHPSQGGGPPPQTNPRDHNTV